MLFDQQLLKKVKYAKCPSKLKGPCCVSFSEIGVKKLKQQQHLKSIVDRMNKNLWNNLLAEKQNI